MQEVTVSSPNPWRSTVSESSFWAVIQSLDWGKEGDDDAVIGPAIEVLARMSPDDIKSFEEELAKKLFALDGEKYAREIGEDSYKGPDDHFSVDEFLYARCVAVANGPEFYKSVLADPKEMPKDMEFEALLRIGPEAYKRKTGKELEHTTKVEYETFSNKEGWNAKKSH
jgi:hypothetical protein